MFLQTLSVGRLRDLLPAMFNKRSLAAEDVQAVAPAKRFRSEMVDIFLNNELSSERSTAVSTGGRGTECGRSSGPPRDSQHPSGSFAEMFPKHEVAFVIFKSAAIDNSIQM